MVFFACILGHFYRVVRVGHNVGPHTGQTEGIYVSIMTDDAPFNGLE